MRILRILRETYADWPGINYSIYVAGCEHRCKGCHNQHTWDFNQGEHLTDDKISEIVNDISSNPMLDNVVISGGDPMHPKNLYGLELLLSEVVKLNKTIVVFTGYLFEDIIDNPEQKRVLKYIDYLVDGPFIEKLHDLNLKWRGSSNQRIIFVDKMLFGAGGEFKSGVFQTLPLRYFKQVS